MKKLTLLFFVIIFYNSLNAQQVDHNFVQNCAIKSDQVVLNDSILLEIKKESVSKGIKANVMTKNLIYFKMLFNPMNSTKESIQIANYIIDKFSDKENYFAINVVFNQKKYLLSKLK